MGPPFLVFMGILSCMVFGIGILGWFAFTMVGVVNHERRLKALEKKAEIKPDMEMF